MSATEERIDHVFKYHPPTVDQTSSYVELRDTARKFAHLINELVPDGEEKRNALARLRETIMWANAGIACS